MNTINEEICLLDSATSETCLPDRPCLSHAQVLSCLYTYLGLRAVLPINPRTVMMNLRCTSSTILTSPDRVGKDVQSSPRILEKMTGPWRQAVIVHDHNLSMVSSELGQDPPELVQRFEETALANCRKSLVEKVRRTRKALSMVFTGASNWRIKV